MDRGRKCSYQLLSRVRRRGHKNSGSAPGALMRWRGVARAQSVASRFLFGPIGVLASAALAACVAGCSASPSNGGRLSLASPAGLGSTVAFESIDGPPPEVFRKLVASLNDEAGARRIAVVSRSAPASYRIRGYVSALVERGQTTFAWVWDVYDSEKRRTLRISGQEPAAAGRRRDARSTANAWTSADDQVVRRIASNGMDQLASLLGSSEVPPVAAPEPNLVALISRRDDSPEAAGILKLFRAPDQTADAPAAGEAVDVLLAPQPPGPAKTRSAAATMATDGRAPRP
jgi:hypothetical protein